MSYSGFDGWINWWFWDCYHRLEPSDSKGYWAPALSKSHATIGNVMVAPPVSVGYQKKDLAHLPSSADGQNTGSGITARAAAGAGVGATLAVVILLFGLLWLLRRYKRNCKTFHEAHKHGERNALREIDPEASEETAASSKQKVEMPNTSRALERQSRDRPELESPSSAR